MSDQYNSYALFENEIKLKDITLPLLNSLWYDFPNHKVRVNQHTIYDTIYDSKQLNSIMERSGDAITSIVIGPVILKMDRPSGEEKKLWTSENDKEVENELWEKLQKEEAYALKFTISFDIFCSTWTTSSLIKNQQELSNSIYLMKYLTMVHKYLLEKCQSVITITFLMENKYRPDDEVPRALVSLVKLIREKNTDFLHKNIGALLFFGFKKNLQLDKILKKEFWQDLPIVAETKGSVLHQMHDCFLTTFSGADYPID